VDFKISLNVFKERKSYRRCAEAIKSPAKILFKDRRGDEIFDDVALRL